jgi:Bacterial Ig domain
MRVISLYVMSMLLLSVVVVAFNLNNPSISMVYGDKGNNNIYNHKDNNKIKNRLINDISDQAVNSNIDTNKEQVQLQPQQIQTQISRTSSQDKATKAINRINSIIDLNPNGPLPPLSVNQPSTKPSSSGQVVSNTPIQSVASHSFASVQTRSLLLSSSVIPQFLVNHPPMPDPKSVKTNENTPIEITLTGTDPDPGDTITFTILDRPLHGTISVGSSPNSIKYTPMTGYVGSDAFTYTATDNHGFARTKALVSITVNGSTTNPLPPTANAGQDQIVNESSPITLDGSKSTDPRGGTLTYLWTQNAGPPVTLSNPTSPIATFTAPPVSTNNVVMLFFTLTVRNAAGLTGSATVKVTVNHVTPTPPPPPPPPVAIVVVSPNQTVNESSIVTLDGHASTDPRGGTLTYLWTQNAGPPVTLSNPTSPIATFTAPPVSANNSNNTVILFFTLTVRNAAGLTGSATVKVTVNHVTPTPLPIGKDPFGVREIYQTKQGGEEWYMNMNNLISDPRLFTRTDQSQFSKNPDGSWKVGPTNNDQGRLHIYTPSGYHQNLITTYNEMQLAAKGYMQSPNDWKNVEMTGYVKLNAYKQVDHAFVWQIRGGHHSTSFSCEGTAYKGNINYVGQTRFQKEQWHPSYFTTSWKNTALAPDPRGKWFGFKYIVYNIQQNGKPAVKMENWLDAKSDGNWVKIDENVDSGGWGTKASQCGGGRPDQLIIWGGPIATFRFDGTTDLDFKNLSVREIQAP